MEPWSRSSNEPPERSEPRDDDELEAIWCSHTIAMNASLSKPVSVSFSCGKQIPVAGSGVQEVNDSVEESVPLVDTEDDPVLRVQLRKTKKRKNRTTIVVTVPMAMFLKFTGMIN